MSSSCHSGRRYSGRRSRARTAGPAKNLCQLSGVITLVKAESSSMSPQCMPFTARTLLSSSPPYMPRAVRIWPRRAAGRADAAHAARELQPMHLRQRRRRDVALLLCAMRAPDLQSHEVILASTRCRQRRRSSCAMRATVGSGTSEGAEMIFVNLTPGSKPRSIPC